ncbi:MAG TPA: 3-oxoacyl-ACP reductase FabG [Xylella sp.]
MLKHVSITNDAHPKRRALVTGGSGELGAAICRRLVTDGLHVIIHANRNRPRADALVEHLCAEGGSAETIAFDVTSTQDSTAALEKLLQAGPIQIIINNAGIHDDTPMAGMSSMQWHRVIDVSLHGFFNVTQPLLLPMARTRWGRIVCVSSVTAVLGNRGQTNYAAAKAGLHGATRSLAREMASRGITVNAVAPGVIQSVMSGETFTPETIKQLIPAGRAGHPEEVAALIGFLCSDNAGYINAQVIGINGGMG